MNGAKLQNPILIRKFSLLIAIALDEMGLFPKKYELKQCVIIVNS